MERLTDVPLRFLNFSPERLREFADLARQAGRHYNRPILWMLIRVIWLRFRHGLMLKEIRLMGLLAADPGAFGVYATVCTRKSIAWMNRLNSPQHRSEVDIKPRFYARCRELGIPVPEVFAVARPDSSMLAGLPASFFVKPANGAGGFGASAFTRDGERFISWNGLAYNGDGLLPHLDSLGAGRELIFQQWLRTHELLCLLPTRALITCRIVTWRPATNPDCPEILFAYLRIPANNSIVDNTGYGEDGQQMLELDTQTGLPVLTWKLDASGFGIAQSDTICNERGLPVSAFQLPDWPATRALALRLSDSFPNLPAIGWDIGISTDGPVAIEGNTAWGVPVYPSGLNAVDRVMRAQHQKSIRT